VRTGSAGTATPNSTSMHPQFKPKTENLDRSIQKVVFLSKFVLPAMLSCRFKTFPTHKISVFGKIVLPIKSSCRFRFFSSKKESRFRFFLLLSCSQSLDSSQTHFQVWGITLKLLKSQSESFDGKRFAARVSRICFERYAVWRKEKWRLKNDVWR